MNETRQGRGRPRGVKVNALTRWLLPSIGSCCLWLVLYLLIFSAGRFLLDSDTGWHIRTGELIWQTRSVPRLDPFSHTMEGHEWFAWEWLSDLLMALAHGRWGLAGVVGGAILVLLAGYLALYRLMVRQGSDPLLALAMTLLAALCGMVHWLARPHLFSIGLMVAWLFLVESYRRHRRRWIYLVPLLVLIWANLHGAFVAALVGLGIYGAGEWLESAARGRWWDGELRRVLRTYLSVGILSAAAALATPYGFRLYEHIWRYLTDAELLNSIHEFQSPDFHSADGKLIEALLLLGGLAAVNALRQGRLVEAGLFLWWGHLTLQSERHVTLAAVVIAPIIAEQAGLFAAEMAERLSGGETARSRAVRGFSAWYRGIMALNRQLTGGLALTLAWIFLLAVPFGSRADRWLAPHFNSNRMPVAAADFILQTRPAGRMFSSDSFGGYLIYRLYPQFKVFVDGRSDFYRQGPVLEELMQIRSVRPQWAELLDKYDVQWMVLSRSEPLATVALMSGEWTRVHEDSVAQVLIRKGSTRSKLDRY